MTSPPRWVPVRFSEYLATLPEADQAALTNDLTLGYGRLGFAVRLHREDPPTAAMLGALAAAHAGLRAAQETLEPGAPAHAPPRAAAGADALPPAWRELLTAGARETVWGLLAMAAEMARDAVAATAADAELEVVRALVGDALWLLADARDDALGGA